MSSVEPSYQAPAGPTRLGRYELIGKLATGGMAEIYLARLAGEAGFEKLVVVKRLLPELCASRAFVEMFLAEGKLVARLDHPNICEVHELGRDGADYFLAMPYLDGVSVAALAAQPIGDPVQRARLAAGVAVQACAGLHYAHELADREGASLELVHRDVSPSNLFVTTAGVVKVLDFGIAKVRGASAETEVGMIKGKAQYMAPEQVAGTSLDRRCDVFALGIVLYELVTGARLFDRESDYLVAKAILENPIPRADATTPGVPAALADAIAHALARDRAARPATALELAHEIEAAIAPASPAELAAALGRDLGGALDAQRTRQARVLASARGASSALATKPRAIARSRRPAAITAAALAAILVAGGVAVVAITAAARDHVGSRATVAASADARGLATTVAVATPPPPDAADPPEIDLAPDPSPSPHHASRPGELSVDSTPWATIAIDGRAIGVTPLLHVRLPAGKHVVRATTNDGRTRDVTVAIEAGRAAPPLVLRW